MAGQAEVDPVPHAGEFGVVVGFLGVQWNPYIVQNVKQPLANTDYAPGVNMVRFLKRKQALDAMESA